jgi:hypothetical protein
MDSDVEGNACAWLCSQCFSGQSAGRFTAGRFVYKAGYVLYELTVPFLMTFFTFAGCFNSPLNYLFILVMLMTQEHLVKAALRAVTTQLSSMILMICLIGAIMMAYTALMYKYFRGSFVKEAYEDPESLQCTQIAYC